MLWHLDFFTFGLTTFLSMHLPFESSVDVGRLSRIYDKTVATYKFYWFVSIINLVSTNPDRRVFSFNEIIAGIISEDARKPEGLCDSAWESMRPFVEDLAAGRGNFFDGWMRNPLSAMISCNDGFRPVSFYLEVVG